jgi:hypothetical protein
MLIGDVEVGTAGAAVTDDEHPAISTTAATAR